MSGRDRGGYRGRGGRGGRGGRRGGRNDFGPAVFPAAAVEGVAALAAGGAMPSMQRPYLSKPLTAESVREFVELWRAYERFDAPRRPPGQAAPLLSTFLSPMNIMMMGTFAGLHGFGGARPEGDGEAFSNWATQVFNHVVERVPAGTMITKSNAEKIILDNLTWNPRAPSVQDAIMEFVTKYQELKLKHRLAFVLEGNAMKTKETVKMLQNLLTPDPFKAVVSQAMRDHAQAEAPTVEILFQVVYLHATYYTAYREMTSMRAAGNGGDGGAGRRHDGNGGKRFDGNCNYCGIKGHKEAECRKKTRETASAAPPTASAGDGRRLNDGNGGGRRGGAGGGTGGAGAGRKRTPKCYACGESGHMRDQCPNAARTEPAAGGAGKPAGGGVGAAHTMMASQGCDVVFPEKVIIHCSIQGPQPNQHTTFDTMFDTGADRNYLTASDALSLMNNPRVRVRTMVPGEWEVMTGNGRLMASHELTADVRVVIGGTHERLFRDVTFLVVPNMQAPMSLLSHTLWQQFGFNVEQYLKSFCTPLSAGPARLTSAVTEPASVTTTARTSAVPVSTATVPVLPQPTAPVRAPAATSAAVQLQPTAMTAIGSRVATRSTPVITPNPARVDAMGSAFMMFSARPRTVPAAPAVVQSAPVPAQLQHPVDPLPSSRFFHHPVSSYPSAFYHSTEFTSTERAAAVLFSEEKEEVDHLPPGLGPLNRVDIDAVLQGKLDEAVACGFNPAAADIIADGLFNPTTDYADCFRLHFSGDPPMDVEPISFKFKDTVWSLRFQPRYYNPAKSEYLRITMEQFCSWGWVYRNPDARVASPAHPVWKPGLPPWTPVSELFRFTSDFVFVNNETYQCVAPLPTTESVVREWGESTCSGATDMIGGFWQAALHPDSQEQLSIMTDVEVFTPTRLPQGCVNASQQFHHRVVQVFEDLVPARLAVYIDDLMPKGKDHVDLAMSWMLVCERAKARNVKFSAHKTVFFSPENEFCGRVFTEHGVKFPRSYTNAVTDMPEPSTVGELRTYTGMLSWMRIGLPRYAERVMQLSVFQTEAIAEASAVSSKLTAINNTRLTDVGWNSELSEAYADTKDIIARAVTLAYLKPGYYRGLMTDASTIGWGAICFQYPISEEHLPINERHLEPLGFASGLFNQQQQNWATIDQEMFALMTALERFEPYLVDLENATRVWMDHGNAVHLLRNDVPCGDARRQASPKLERWMVRMSRFWLQVHHIPGVLNIIADALSRWAATSGDLPPRRYDDTVSAASVSAASASATVDVPQPFEWPHVAMAVMTRAQRRAQTAGVDDASTPPTTDVTSVTPDPVPTAEPAPPTDIIIEPLTDSASVSVTEFAPGEDAWFSRDDCPTEIELADAQRIHLDSDTITQFKLTVSPSTGLWSLPGTDIVFVPDCRHLRLRIAITAHQGMAGHRGADVTLHWVMKYFWWPTVERDIRTFTAVCLHCLRTRGGRTVHRPYRETVRATAPGVMLHADYYYVTAASELTPHGYQYLLVLKCNYSHYVQLFPIDTPTASHMCDSLLRWIAAYGPFHTIMTDRGSHFTAAVLRELIERMGVDHHFTAVYAPWSNGVIERVNREIREIMSAITSDSLLPDYEWPLLVPLVTSVINNSPAPSLADYAPITVFMGREPSSPLDVIFNTTTHSLQHVPVATNEIVTHVRQLRDTLDTVRTRLAQRPTRARAPRTGEKEIDFDVGDYVLTATVDVKRVNKTAPIWRGPALVVERIDEKTFKVVDVGNDTTQVLNAEHLKRYADASLVVTPQLKAFAAHGGKGFLVDNIVQHRWKSSTSAELLIHWEGLPLEEATWEPFAVIRHDIPAIVLSYIKSVADSADRDRLLTLYKRLP